MPSLFFIAVIKHSCMQLKPSYVSKYMSKSGVKNCAPLFSGHFCLLVRCDFIWSHSLECVAKAIRKFESRFSTSVQFTNLFPRNPLLQWNPWSSKERSKFAESQRWPEKAKSLNQSETSGVKNSSFRHFKQHFEVDTTWYTQQPNLNKSNWAIRWSYLGGKNRKKITNASLQMIGSIGHFFDQT